MFAAAKSMIEHMPAMFGLNALEPWQRFQREHPRKLADVPDAARPALQLPPTLIADAPLPKPLFEQLKEYNETIQYTNPTSKTIYTNHKSRGNLVAANLANEKIPDPVRKGEMLFVKAEQGDETFESNQVTRAPNRSPHSWRSNPLCASSCGSLLRRRCGHARRAMRNQSRRILRQRARSPTKTYSTLLGARRHFPTLSLLTTIFECPGGLASSPRRHLNTQ